MTIRALTSTLAAFLLAVAVALLGYAALVTWRRAPVPTRPLAEGPAPPAPLPAALALAPIPPRALPAPASFAAPLPRATGEVALELRGAPADGLGVAILDGDSGATLGWQEITGATTGLSFTGVPVGEHWWAVARDFASARFAYVSRGRVRVREDGDSVRGSAVVELTRAGVLVKLAWPNLSGVPPIVVPSLMRADDPAWYFLPEHPFELVASESFAYELRDLGPGTYTLALDGAEVDPADRARLVFTVPGTTQIVLRCRRP
jgi:hypothetical protein